MTVYVSVGNSDDKLSQLRWSALVDDVSKVVYDHASKTHGLWYSQPASRFQNACWCFDITPEKKPPAQRLLGLLAVQYSQDSIAWAEAPETEFLRADDV
ncbi:hypothetical protein ACFP2T_35690 [Plantactinospora solaniradicis]|uniref:Uncharacterized protein n=1 Tax=Plantactinospora solaniradicis TaxID=1723736 RepID=A0ABW1KKY0_9ACTN